MMGRDNKYPPQTFDEMVKSAEENKSHSKIYKAESMELSDDRISCSVAKATDELISASNMERIDLVDTESVKERTAYYMRACETASAFPTISGLARSFGMSRNALYTFMNSRPHHETSKWLEMVRDSFAELLEQNSLRKNCDTITSIFLLKASYGYRESVEILTHNSNDIIGAEEIPLDELKEAYANQMGVEGTDEVDIPDIDDIK